MSVFIRSFRGSDLTAVVDILSRGLPLDAIDSAKFTRQVLLDPNVRADGMLVAEDAGNVVGFCLAIARRVPLENAPPDDDRGYITLLGTAESHRRRGIGTQLIAAAEVFLRGQNRSLVLVSPYAPGYFTPGIDVVAGAAGVTLFEKLGYRVVARPLSMRVPLESRPSDPKPLAKGVELLTFRDEHALPLVDFAAEHFGGDWVRFVREAANRITFGESPTRLISAIEGGRIVGFAHYNAARFGPIGVAETQRGRGIGRALMYATLAAQFDAGHKSAFFLWTDDTTAERLYTPAGFVEWRRFALMKKAIT